MGLFSRKKKTKVERTTTRETFSKIVKLTYLQTLAIEGGLSSIGDVAGETSSSTTNIDTANSTQNDITKISNNLTRNLPKNYLVQINPITQILKGFASVVNSLFGKSKSVSAKGTISSSGWSVTKTWKQPQFDVIRYAIGLKEVVIAQFTYESVSEIISKPWGSPKEISKITLVVDQFIPNQFPAGGQYIEYYIKPDIEQAEWIRINPIGLPTIFTDSGKIVPRILSFNTERPVNSNLEDAYITTDKPVRSVIFRALLKRPESIENSDVSANAYTPILKSYRILLTPKGGLA